LWPTSATVKTRGATMQIKAARQGQNPDLPSSEMKAVNNDLVAKREF
jgi:hypothetical protein